MTRIPGGVVSPASKAPLTANPAALPAWRETLYKASSTFLNGEHLVDSFFSKRLKKMSSSNPLKWLGNIAHTVLKPLASQDMTQFKTAFGIPVRFAIPSGKAIGSLMLMMYVGLAYARAKRGYDRGILPNGKRDTREMWDAIRRDGFSITLYIFGLGKTDKWFSQLSQKSVGFNIFDNKGGEPYSFSALSTNARLENPRVMATHFKHGHGPGIIKAANHNGYFGLPEFLRKDHPKVGEQLAHWIDQFRAALNPLKGLDPKVYKTASGQKTLTQATEKASQALTQLDAVRTQFLESQAKAMGKQGGMASKALQQMVKQLPEFKDFFSVYTRNNRAPIGLYSFLTILVLIGYGPIWFNWWWTERQYAKLKQTSPQSASKAPEKSLSLQGLSASLPQKSYFS